MKWKIRSEEVDWKKAIVCNEQHLSQEQSQSNHPSSYSWSLLVLSYFSLLSSPSLLFCLTLCCYAFVFPLLTLSSCHHPTLLLQDGWSPLRDCGMLEEYMSNRCLITVLIAGQGETDMYTHSHSDREVNSHSFFTFMHSLYYYFRGKWHAMNNFNTRSWSLSPDTCLHNCH